MDAIQDHELPAEANDTNFETRRPITRQLLMAVANSVVIEIRVANLSVVPAALSLEIGCRTRSP